MRSSDVPVIAEAVSVLLGRGLGGGKLLPLVETLVPGVVGQVSPGGRLLGHVVLGEQVQVLDLVCPLGGDLCLRGSLVLGGDVALEARHLVLSCLEAHLRRVELAVQTVVVSLQPGVVRFELRDLRGELRVGLVAVSSAFSVAEVASATAF